MEPVACKRSPHDWLRLTFRHLRLFLLGASLFAVAALVAAHFVPTKYKGKAIFEFGLEAAAEQISQTGRESFGTIKERLQHDLAGYQATHAAATELGLMQGLPRDREGRLTVESRAQARKIVEDLMRNIKVTWEARSNQEDLVSIVVTHHDARLAEQLPNALVAGYVNRTYERIQTGLKLQHEFLRNKVDDCDKVLDELTKKKIRFETEYAGILPENPGALQEKIHKTRTDIDALRRQHAVAKANQARLDALKARCATQPSGEPLQVVRQPNPELARLKEQLRQLEDELETALTRLHMTEKHPTVLAIQSKIAQLERRIEQTPEEVIKEKVFGLGGEQGAIDLAVAVAAVESSVETTARELESLEGSLVGLEKLWANFSSVRQDYLGFLKDWENHKIEADHWRRRLGNVEVALVAAVNNRLTRLKAVQPAQEQFLPAWPSLWAVLGFAMGGGLLVGCGLIFAAGLVDRSVATPEDAASFFDVPVQGVIGEIVTPRQRRLRLLKRWMLQPIVALVVLAALGLSMMSICLRIEHPRLYKTWTDSPAQFVQSQIWESARKVAANM